MIINPMTWFGLGKSIANQANKEPGDIDCETCNGRGVNLAGFDCRDCNGTGVKQKDEE